MNTQYPLQHFIKAHEDYFEQAFTEICNGKKETHWMWFIFPQIQGLGQSETSEQYAIVNLKHAREFLSNPTLYANLQKICKALVDSPQKTAIAIFGPTDATKLRSSMTLFSLVEGAPAIFIDVLSKYYNATPDRRTLKLLKEKKIFRM